MTVTLLKPTRRWGVRFEASVDRVNHIDPRADEADARRWLHALKYMGNHDAVLVVDDGHGWHEATNAGDAR